MDESTTMLLTLLMKKGDTDNDHKNCANMVLMLSIYFDDMQRNRSVVLSSSLLVCKE